MTWLIAPVSVHATAKVHALVHDATCLLGRVTYQAFNEFLDECSQKGWHPLLLELDHAFLLTCQPTQVSGSSLGEQHHTCTMKILVVGDTVRGPSRG